MMSGDKPCAKSLSDILKLSAPNAQLLEQQAKQVHIDSTGPVIHKGQVVSGAYTVLEGELRVYSYAPNGTEATLYRLLPGETCVLTLNCLFNDLRYPAWVEACSPSRLAIIPGKLYRHFFAEEASVRDATVMALSTLVFRLMDELEQVHNCNLEQRLARFLLNKADNDGMVHMTQQMLAQQLGTTREVVARHMQTLVVQGVVSSGRGKVTVVNAKALAAIVTPEDAIWPA